MKGDCWPTPEQTLLLRAALLRDDAGRRAVAEWSAGRRPDLQLGRASARLLPLLYLQVHAIAPDDPLTVQLRAIHKDAVARNTEIAGTVAAAIGVLTRAGIETAILKGMGLVARGFMPLGGRLMADGDLLVREDHAIVARDVLIENGFGLEGRLDADLIPVRHAVPLRGQSGRQIDLHWHALAECCARGADADFWQAAEPVVFEGLDTKTLCPADMLLHACAHGLRWSIVPPIRWVADASLIMQGAGSTFDWERLVEQASRRVLALPIHDALHYLRESLDAPVPAWVLGRLATAPVPRWARGEYRVKTSPRNPTRQVLFHWFQHRRLSASGSLLLDLMSAPRYVQRRWRLGASRTRATG